MKKGIITIIKIILELVLLAILIFAIVYLLKYSNGVIQANKYSKAQEKLDTAIKIFSSSDGLSLEDAINDIEGLDSLEIDEGGMYRIVIDGIDFLVVSQEVFPEDAEPTNEDTTSNEGEEEIIENTEEE